MQLVQETDYGTPASTAGTMVTLTGLPALEPVAAEATRRLDAALSSLG